MTAFLPLLVLSLTFSTAHADSKDRDAAIRKGVVWEHPAWMDKDFQFADSFDMKAGPSVLPEDEIFVGGSASCTMTKKTSLQKSRGQTMKFRCALNDGKPTPRIIKVKYKFDDGEISGEMLATRLFWALGFGADQMFFLDRLDCFGCTADPFRDRRVDSSTLQSPRRFEWVATERVYPGHEIDNAKTGETGWGFDELMRLLPKAAAKRERARVERDALRLLSVFVRHADNKPENQTLSCLGKVTAHGGCHGSTRLIVHDLGATFGFGMRGDGHVSKAIFDHWKESEIWADAKRCIGRLGDNAYGEMEEPQISREGHIFPTKLLKGFSGGPKGRERVRALFALAHAEERGASIEEWTELFLAKVRELAGDDGPVCVQD